MYVSLWRDCKGEVYFLCIYKFSIQSTGVLEELPIICLEGFKVYLPTIFSKVNYVDASDFVAMQLSTYLIRAGKDVTYTTLSAVH